MKRILNLLIILAVPLLVHSRDREDALFKQGNAYYSKGQYIAAYDVYKKILDDGYRSAALYFNIGNASYKKGDIASALLYLEKAHKLAPGDDDINFNIKFVNSRTTDRIDEAPEFFLAHWWKTFILVLSLNTLSVVSVILIVISSVFFIIYIFTNSISLKKSSFYTALSCLFIGLLSIFIANSQANYFNAHHQAIVFSGTVNVKSSPGEKPATLFVIHEGAKVNILENTGGWLKISLINGTQGWLKASDVREI